MADPVRFTPQEGRQKLFVMSRADECAWIGEAGTGKGISYFLDYLYDVHKPLHNGIMFRKAYKDLEDLLAKANRMLPAYGGKFDEKSHVWKFPSGARLWMAYLEDERDVMAWNGHEFTAIYWDELSQFSRVPYLFMFRNLRCSDGSIPKRVRNGSNPDGYGAPWVWERFYKTLAEGEIGFFKTVNGKDVRLSPIADPNRPQLLAEWVRDTPKADRGFSRQWFRGIRAENLLGDPDYERNLDNMPTERLRQAYKFGILTEADHPDQLIRSEWIEAALNGKNQFEDGNKSFGLDYSEGGDNCIMYAGTGNQVDRAWEWSDKDFLKHPVLARWLADWIRTEGKYQIYGGIDTVGTGAGVFTCLQDIDPGMAERVSPVRHKDLELEKTQDVMVRLKFKTIQDQLLWKLREDFSFGRIDLSPLTSGNSYYSNVHLLKEELLAFRFQENKNSDGSMWISSSNDLRRSSWPGGEPCLGRSPDRAKALAIWNGSRNWDANKFPKPVDEQVDYQYNKGMKNEVATSPYV